jgi:hypothetical protein
MRDHPGYCTAEVGNPGGTYELPCTYVCVCIYTYTECPTTYPTRHSSLIILPLMRILHNNQTHYRHIPLHFSPTNVLLFKSLCNILIGLGIIKELPGLVGSGTPCIYIHTHTHTHTHRNKVWYIDNKYIHI